MSAPGVAPERGAARMARIFGALLSADLITRALGAVATIIVVRAMAPAAFGEIAYAVATAAVVGVLVDLGFQTLLMRDVSADPARGAALLGGVLKLQAALALLVFGGGAALGAAGLLGGPSAPTVMALAFAVMAASAVERPFRAALAGYGRAHLATAANAARGVALVAFTAAAMLIEATPAAALLAALAAELVGAAAIWILSSSRAIAPTFAGGAVDLRGLLRRAVPFALFAGFALLYSRIDTIMLGALGTDDDVGAYGLAVRGFEVLLAAPWFFGSAFLATVAQPGIERAEAARQTRRALRLLLLVCVPLAFAAAVTAEPLVPLVAGDDYSAAAEILVRLSPVLALTAVYAVLASLQIALDRTAVVARITLAGVALKVALSAWAIPRWGANGAAVTVVAAEAVVLVAQWYSVRSIVGDAGLGGWAARLALATLVMLAAGVPLAVEVSWAAGLVAGLVAFAVAARLAGCTSPAELRAAWTSVTARGPA